MKFDTNIDYIIQQLSKTIKDLPYEIANDMKNTIVDRFRTKEYNGNRWQESIFNENTLIKDGNLRGTIRIVSVSQRAIEIEFGEPYAVVHNVGAKIIVTEKMQSYFWSQYYKTKDETFKYLAMKPIGTTVNIPKREMVGSDDKQMVENIYILLNNLFNEDI